MPKVSIVVPVYNVERYLDQCVQSIRNQTLQDIEIILVDDESPDNCPALCDAYAAADARIKVVHKKNAGLGMACNSGIEVAVGEYIAFCDSDDWVDLAMYQSMYDWAKENDADAVFTGYLKVTDDGMVHGQSLPEKDEVLDNRESIENLMLEIIATKPSDRVGHHTPMSAKTVLYKRLLLEQYHLRFESERKLMSEDIVWNCDVLMRASRVVVKRNALYYYRKNPASLSEKVRKDRFLFHVALREEMLSRYAACVEYGELRNRVNKMFIGYNRIYLRQVWNVKVINLRDKCRITDEICGHVSWTEIRKTYPISSMPFKHRIMFAAVSNKLTCAIALLCKIAGKN